MLSSPDVNMPKAWLAGRLKVYKDYDRLEIFKEAGRKCITEILGRLEVST